MQFYYAFYENAHMQTMFSYYFSLLCFYFELLIIFTYFKFYNNALYMHVLFCYIRFYYACYIHIFLDFIRMHFYA
jgi:hypothetical protein